MLQPWMIPADLAPGDPKSLDRDWSGLTLHNIEATDDPLFDMAFGALWAEFGARGEVEQASVLSLRMRWDGKATQNDCALLYRMMLLTCQGKFAAVRDHTAITQNGKRGTVVHLSHNLIAPEWRRTGLAGWLRALPIQTARHGLAAQNRAADAPIVLVAEMEHPDPRDTGSLVRLEAYEKAGYLKVDPRRVHYLQPDFRTPEEIDLSDGPSPLPMTLMVRRVGCEARRFMKGAEVREIVEALYRMYAASFRPQDMAGLFAGLQNYPGENEEIELVVPTETDAATIRSS